MIALLRLKDKIRDQGQTSKVKGRNAVVPHFQCPYDYGQNPDIQRISIKSYLMSVYLIL